MQKSSIIRLFYGLWTVFTLILTIIVLMLPLIVWIFWNEVISYGMIPIFILLGLLLPLAIFGLVIFIRIFQAYHHKSSIHPRRNIVFKLLPILILGTVFGGYWYFFPGWIYDVGMPPQYGPYISLHAKGGMQISWDTAFPTPSEVQYGFSENNLSLTEYGGDYYWQTDPTLKSTHHCVLLSHLESNCTVYYTIPGFDNHIYQFQTPPLDNQIQKVTFTIQGDTQGNFNIQKQNIALIRANIMSGTNLNYMVIAGDLCNADDRISEWSILMNKRSYGGLISEIPLQACSGNHETISSKNIEPRIHFKHYFQNAYASNWIAEPGLWDIGLYYSYNYSNVHMVILDTLENRNHQLNPAQLAWLETDLSNANAANMWTIVVFHTTMYSTSDHGSYPILANQMEPIMKRQHIDAIFWGHDHGYESFLALSNETYGGTYCFTVAGGGGSLKDVSDPENMGTRVWNGTKNEYGNYINYVAGATDSRFNEVRGHEWQLYAECTHHYMQIDIENQTASFTAYRTQDGSIIQKFVVNNK